MLWAVSCVYFVAYVSERLLSYSCLGKATYLVSFRGMALTMALSYWLSWQSVGGLSPRCTQRTCLCGLFPYRIDTRNSQIPHYQRSQHTKSHHCFG